MPRWQHFKKANTETETTEITKTAPETPVISPDVINTLADTVRALQAEVKTLKGKEVPVFTKEKYVWPRQYRYKLYSEVINDSVVNTPILSYRWIKLDPTQELVYSNGNGGYDNNHYVILTLQGRKDTVKVPINTFMRVERSEPTFPKYVIDTDGERIKGDSKLSGREWFANEIAGYVFENELGEFTVSPNCIN